MTLRHTPLPTLAVCLLLAACGGGTAAAPSPSAAATSIAVRYSSFSAQYIATSHSRTEQHLPSGQLSGENVTVRVHFRVRVAESGNGLAVALTIDSVPELLGTGLPVGEAVRAQGTVFTGRMAATGRIVDFTGGDSSIALVRLLRTTFRDFFPSIPPGGAVPGARWIDTVQTVNLGGDMEVVIESVLAHEVLGWTDYAGRDALHISTMAQYTLAGSGTQMGQEISLDGTGVRHEHHYLAADGTYLGATAADTSTSIALVVAMDLTIPITQTRVDSLRITS